MNKFKNYIIAGIVAGFLAGSAAMAACGAEHDKYKPQRGEISLKSTGAGLASLILPGLGQYINEQPKRKVVTHGVAWLLLPGVIHLFSSYDALFDREGGYVDGRV